jgi:autotransporter strand-loop-strand O-heptosyltransferase
VSRAEASEPAALRQKENVFGTRRGSTIRVSFRSQPRVEIHGQAGEFFEVSFVDTGTDSTVYSTVIRNGMWAAADPRYYVPWKIRIANVDDPSEVYEYTLDLEGQDVLVINDSPTLGDAIAWMPYVEEFRRRFRCRVAYRSPHRDLFEGAYPEIRFLGVGEELRDPPHFISYALRIDLEPPFTSQRNAHQTVPLQQIAADILGLEFEELRPRIASDARPSLREPRYVCIATQSTAQAKYWTREGWDALVGYLKSHGYDVLCIDRHRVFGIEGWWNAVPGGCVDKTGDLDLGDRIADLRGCAFFVGLSSGLAWLAWALGKPVVLISGFTDPLNEFRTPYRVINRGVCNSCWNDLNHRFDPSNWTWCPRHEKTDRMFECARGISFASVKEKVDACIRSL